MRLYEARPDGQPRGGLVVIQEAFGVNEHIEDVTGRAAEAGYLAVAPDLFHRTGGGTVPYGQFEQVIEKFQGIPGDDAILVDVDAALDHLRAAGLADSQIGIVGFCMGGRVTFLIATARPLGAAVGFYGGGIVTSRFPQFPALIDRAGDLKAPWLGLFGDDDQSIPVDDVERLRNELGGSGTPVAHEIVRYAGAGHGFHCDQRESFDEAASVDAWARTLAWLAEHLR
jgi:carboxymethylenebutenolidase